MTDIADEIKELPADADLGVVRHPSGWWKSSERWNPPAHAEGIDRKVALSLAVAAIILGSVQSLDGNGLGNLTLLLGGIAGALIARWWIDGAVDGRWITASVALCSMAAVVSLYEVAVLAQHTAQPPRGLFLALAGAVGATALTTIARKSPVAVS